MKRYVGIDPSTFTGFVILNESGEIIEEQEIWFEYKKDPERMNYISERVIEQLNIDTDVICIENFSYNSTGRGVDYQYGIGWIIREKLFVHGFKFYDVAPNALKRFATGNGSVKKEVMVAPIYRRWGYTNISDNITDAFVLAKIAEAIDKGNKGLKEHEKLVVRTVKNSVMNQEEFWEEQKKPVKSTKRKKLIEELTK